MILTKEFHRCAVLASQIRPLMDKEENEKYRKNNFFPRRQPTFKANINGNRFLSAAYLIDKPVTPGYDPKHFAIYSGFCCGFMEITAALYPIFSASDTAFLLPLKISPDDARKAALADSIEALGHGRGVMIYNHAPKSVEAYDNFAKILKEFGFSKIFSFANPNHGGREVETLVCHTVSGSSLAKGKSWLDFSTTRAADIAALETTSGSTTTAANSASAATGTVRRPARIG